jgi:hypothetical protein
VCSSDLQGVRFTQLPREPERRKALLREIQALVVKKAVTRLSYSLDLRDAYLHVPIRESSQKWLRFAVGAVAYQFRVLPFDLSTAPWTFARIVIVVAEFLRRRGRSFYVFLDDWLLVAPSL